MSSKKKGKLPKKDDVPTLSKKINFVFLRPESSQLEATYKNLMSNNLLADSSIYIIDENGLNKLNAEIDGHILLKTIDLESIEVQGSFVIIDHTDSCGEEIKNWIQLKNQVLKEQTQRIIYRPNWLDSSISNQSICVPSSHIKDILKLIQDGVSLDVITSSIFDPTLKSQLIPAASAMPNSLSWINRVKSNLLFFTKDTLHQVKNWSISSKVQSIEHPMWRGLLIGLLSLSLIYLIIGGIHAGIGGDEFRYLNQAEKVGKFYSTFGKDTTAYTKVGVDPQHYNGQIFDNVISLIGKPFGLMQNFTYRHVLTGIMTWLCLLACAFTVVCLMNYQTAVFAMLLMILTPVFMGNGFNNHRDIPLATGIAICMYAVTQLRRRYPALSKKYLFLLLLGMLISFGQRIAGGFMAAFLMGVYVVIIVLEHGDLMKLLKFNKATWTWSIGIAVTTILGLALSILTWPYGLINPIKNAYEVFTQSGNLSVSLYQTFEGKYNLSSQMPNYYVFKYMGITIPIIVLISFVLFVYYTLTNKIRNLGLVSLFLIFAFLFPVIYSYLKLGNFYGSWRHFLFTYPFLVIGAAIGWNTLMQSIPALKSSFLSLGILALTLLHPLQYIIRNHPFEYLYYNEIEGGPSGAYSKYELDYSLNSLKQGSEWLKDYIRKNHPKGTKLVVASNGGSELTQYFNGFDDSVSTIYTRYYERGTQLWDYAIFPNMYIHPFQLKNNIFPSGDSLHTIKIDGKPLCFIYKRRSTEDYQAVQALNKGDANLAVQKFQAYLKHNPKSEWAWFQLAYIFAQNSNWAQAQTYVTESFKFHPEFLPSRALQGLIYINTNRLKDAQPIFDKLIEDKYDLVNSYKWSGMTYENEKNYRKALQQYGFALGAGNQQKDTYAKIANCFRQLGDVNQAQKYEAMSQ